ncbi:FAD-dependent monooxygenase [Ruegeria arenilitoris]|uniref:FAD-dependent monooxygenase n=1 Tax=Ruegeria arenilitoris TaxID=1173585 RepID=UPI00147A2EE1|nr:FAD-dependent monooxygenase [Ruegeria arenilitoris]
MNIEGLKFCVIGAGIGGLAAAIALRQRGAEVLVLEQAPEIAEVGAGLQISANGMRVLRALGVVGDVPEAGQKSYGTVLRDYRGGRFISRIPAPAAGPTYYYHRADLIDLLLRAAVASGVNIRLDAKVEQIHDAPDDVGVVLGNGEEIGADCTIAADGGRSSIRPALNGEELLGFTHQVAWRATIPWDRNLTAPKAHLTMGPGRHVVTYPLRNQSLMNIVAIEERSDWQEEGWRLKGDPNDLRARFADFGGKVQEVLQEVQETHLWALFLRPVARKWQNGRIALLGDAAHPTLPFMAQGACLALEDAWILAKSFDQDDVTSSLEAYETKRAPRARRVVDAASSNARNFHLRGPMRIAAQMALTALGPRMGRRYDWIYDYDPTA